MKENVLLLENDTTNMHYASSLKSVIFERRLESIAQNRYKLYIPKPNIECQTI